MTPVPGLATSTATGIARRFTGEHWRGAEAGLARAMARMLGLLSAERAAELAAWPVTIDIDATDVEVYGSKKRGVAYNYQRQRAGLPHVASWAETWYRLLMAVRGHLGGHDAVRHCARVRGSGGLRWPTRNRGCGVLPRGFHRSDGACRAGMGTSLPNRGRSPQGALGDGTRGEAPVVVSSVGALMRALAAGSWDRPENDTARGLSVSDR